MSRTTPSTEGFSEHGVFLVIFNYGVLLRGPAGIGKSSLALELIERGHQLIADDIVEFKRDSRRQFIAQCPRILTGLLAVRDLGILNITDLFHAERIREKSPLHLIVDLVESPVITEHRQFNPYSPQDFHGQSVQTLQIHAQSQRNLAIYVETAVKNYILYKSGKNASKLLIQRQQQYL